MLIDWFTTAAQIVNFLILIALLKKFLYGPIIRAMDEREAKIASRLTDAENRQQQAQEQKQEFERKTQDLEKKHEELVAKARKQADERREELVRQARADTDKLRANWEESVRREKEMFLHDLQHQAALHTCAAARHVLAELADAELEKQIVNIWRDRLSHLDQQDKDRLRKAAGEASNGAVVRTTFELSADQRRELTRVVHRQVDRDVAVDYQTDKELVCGIELRVGGFKLAWTAADYLGSLQESVGEFLEQAAEKDESKETS